MVTFSLRSLLLAVTCAAGIVAGAAETASRLVMVDISAKVTTGAKYAGAAPAGDGRVVFAPHHANGVGVFDPTDDSFSLVDISDNALSKFRGAAPAGDGRVVFAPFNANAVGVFDPTRPTDDSFSLVDISATVTTAAKFFGAALAGDGRVVFAPHNADSVGVFTLSCTCCESTMMKFGFSVGRVCTPP